MSVLFWIFMPLSFIRKRQTSIDIKEDKNLRANRHFVLAIYIYIVLCLLHNRMKTDALFVSRSWCASISSFFLRGKGGFSVLSSPHCTSRSVFPPFLSLSAPPEKKTTTTNWTPNYITYTNVHNIGASWETWPWQKPI